MKQTLLLILAMILLTLPAAAQQGKAAGVQVKATATVTSIDQKTRMVTLKTDDGKEITTEVSPQVKNLKQVKVGDVVTITYTAAVAIRINPATPAPQGETATVAAAKPGEKPAGGVGKAVTVSARVEAIDLAANTVTFKGPRGNLRTVAVQDSTYRAKLKELKVGDTVEITYAEAVTVSVQEAPKK